MMICFIFSGLSARLIITRYQTEVFGYLKVGEEWFDTTHYDNRVTRETPCTI